MVANGDIWSVADAQRCRAVTGCTTLMMGRGMVRRPGLALAIAQADAAAGAHSANHGAPSSDTDPAVQALPWRRIEALLVDFWADVSARVERRHRAGRLKLWLNYLRHAYPEAQQAFDVLRLVNDADAIGAWLLSIQERLAQDSRAPEADFLL